MLRQQRRSAGSKHIARSVTKAVENLYLLRLVLCVHNIQIWVRNLVVNFTSKNKRTIFEALTAVVRSSQRSSTYQSIRCNIPELHIFKNEKYNKLSQHMCEPKKEIKFRNGKGENHNKNNFINCIFLLDCSVKSQGTRYVACVTMQYIMWSHYWFRNNLGQTVL